MTWCMSAAGGHTPIPGTYPCGHSELNMSLFAHRQGLEVRTQAW